MNPLTHAIVLSNPHSSIPLQVFYSDFSDDPWQRASVWFSPSTSQPYHLAMCDDCGHCMDLHAPSEKDPAPLVSVNNAIVCVLFGMMVTFFFFLSFVIIYGPSVNLIFITIIMLVFV